MPPVLKLEKDDPDKEREFELRFLLSLSTKEKFQMMFNKSKEIRNLLEKNGHRIPHQVIKRT